MLGKLLKRISRITLPRIVVIGVDIQDRHVLGVATLRHEGEVKLLHSEVFEIPEDAIENGELKRPEVLDVIVQKLVDAVPQGRWWKDNEPIFVLSIPPERLYTETLFFPSMNDIELEEAIRLKLETSLPWPQNSAYVDWVVMRMSDRVGVFLAAMAKSVLDQYFRVFLDKGLRVGACEFHLFSLIRFVGTEDAQSFIFVLIDEDGFEFGIFALGGILGHSVQAVTNPKENQQILEDKLKQLTSFVESSYGISVARIFIFDKLSWENLSSQVETVTGVPTQIFTPTSKLIDPELSVAYGASLRPYSSAESLMNLLPENLGGRYQENLVQKTFRFWAINFASVMCVLLGTFLGIFLLLSGQKQVLLKENQESRARFEEKLQQQQDLIAEVGVFNNNASTVSRVLESRPLLSRKLKLITDSLKAHGLSIVEVHMQSAQVSLRFLASARPIADRWRTDLEATGMFASIAIPSEAPTEGANLLIPVTINF
jgi:hypothetical protein